MAGPVAAYTVEVQFGTVFGIPQWFDVSDWVKLSDGGNLQITRGRSDESSQVAPGQLRVSLTNDDGRFTPDNPASPYYPNVLDGAPVRVTARVPAPDGNLEDNPSHEYGIGEWSSGSFSGTAPTFNQRTYGGGVGTDPENALVVTWATQATGSLVRRTVYGLTPGVQYTWSRRVYTATGGPDPFLLVSGNGLFNAGTPVTTKNAWQTATITFVATSRSHSIELWVNSSSAGGVTWTDNGRGDVGAVAKPFTTDKVGARKLDRFTGFALEWPLGWSGGGAYTASTQLVATGVTRRIDQQFGNLRAFDVEEPLLDNPVAFLPLDEPSEATQAGNVGSDPRPAELVNPGGSGLAEFGAGTGPAADGTSSLVLTPAGPNNGFFLRCPTTVFTDACTVEAFINTTTPGGMIVNASVPKGGDPNVGYGMSLRVAPTTGRLQWNSDGGLQVTSSASVADGLTHHVAAVYQHTGTLHTATIYVDGVQVGSGSVASTWVLVMANWFLIGGGSKLNLFTGTINHAGCYASALTVDRLRAHALAGLTGFGGERADQRISRLAAYADLQALTPAHRTGVWVLDDPSASILGTTTILALTDLNADVGSSLIWGQASGGMTPLAGMQDVAATEGGLVTEDRSGFLDFQGRASRYNRVPVVRLDLDDGDVQADLSLAFDDQGVVNDATYSTQDGAKVRYFDAASKAQRGTYADERQLLTRDAADVYSAASWTVNRRGRPHSRYRIVTVDLTAAPGDLAAAVLSVDLGDRFDLYGLPTQAPGGTAVLFAEGYTETLDVDNLTVSFNTSSAEGYQVWTLDNPTLSILGTSTILAW